MARLVIGTSKAKTVPAVVKEPVEQYPLLGRVKDDSNNDIGCVVGYHIDSNNQKYAVVCLNAQYRLAEGNLFNAKTAPSGFTELTGNKMWDEAASATSNCNEILTYITGAGLSSTGLTHCRALSFVIGGVTYYGQIPTMSELTMAFMSRTHINTNDPTAGQYSNLIFPSDLYVRSCSLSSASGGYWWIMRPFGTGSEWAQVNYFIAPILEIPIQ